MAVHRNPTVRQRRLARMLKALRYEARKTAAQAAEHLSCAESKISRIESAYSGIRVVDLRLLLDFYGIPEKSSLRSQLEALLRESQLRGWWDRFSDIISPSYAEYISLEADASHSRNVQALLVPGLLQTEDYTRAVLGVQNQSATLEQVEILTKVRQERRSVLTRSDPLKMWVVLAASVLKHRIGGPAVMSAQLEHLVKASQADNITIQILPEESDIYASLFTPVTILSFPDAMETDVVYADNLLSTLYIEDADEISHYEDVFRRAVADSLSPEKSVALIERTSKEMG